jgi:ABC-type nitrate/sulfonate/bicarbonate transport system permease component
MSWGSFARRWVVFVVCVLAWQAATVLAADPYFPSPLSILDAAGHAWFGDGAFTSDVLPSLGRLLLGWAIAVAVGVSAGLALGRSPVVTDYFSSILFFFRSVPATLLVPIFLVLFGIGPGMEVVTVLWGAVWPVLLNTIDGARSVDDVKVETSRAFGIRGRRWVFGVLLPAAAPKVFAGTRLALSIAIILMVFSELVGSTSGIGFRLNNAQGSFLLPEMWAWIVLVSVLGYLLNFVLARAERRALAWHPGFRAGLPE